MAENAEGESQPVGRPMKYKTVQELDLAIQTYFDEQDPHIVKHMEATGFNERGQTMWAERDTMTQQRPYTMTGLAIAIGLTRQSLLNYQERSHEFFDSIDRARNRCQEYAEAQLFGPYANGAKFSLTNNYTGKYQAWADKQVLAGDKDAPLMPIGLDAAILKRKANGKTSSSTTADSSESS